VAALVSSAYRTTHGGASPSPPGEAAHHRTAGDLGCRPTSRGSGLVNARAAVEAAMTLRRLDRRTGDAASNIVTSENQFTLPDSEHRKAHSIK